MGRNVDASAYQNNEQPFHNMTGLKTLEIYGETTTIQSTTFQGCTSLQTVTFQNDKVSSIGSSAFASCTSLSGIDIPSAVTTIEQSVFNNCRNLKSVTMGDGVTSIGITAFYNTGLTSITLPSALTTINQSAFENSKLTGTLVLPAAVTAVGTHLEVAVGRDVATLAGFVQRPEQAFVIDQEATHTQSGTTADFLNATDNLLLTTKAVAHTLAFLGLY